MKDNNEQRLEQIVFHEELFNSYVEYGKETLERAIPSVTDGCKKVHRRILYAMYKNNIKSNKKYTKCAAVVGATMAEFHPHGDSSIYQALVRLAQDFALKHPLVDGQGNFGSIDGDSAAASRYTECRLSKIGELLMDEIGENTTDFQLNYDGSSSEPIHLVPQYPAILIGGAQGIGVGYSSNIPCHNLGEVLEGVLFLLDNPEGSLLELMDYIKGPDLPTSGVISNRGAIYKAYEKGEGSIIIKGVAHFEGEDTIIITEIPYQVQKSLLVEKIIEMAKNETIDGISSVRDESDSKIRIVVELKKRVQKEVVLNQIYKLTPLSVSYKINLLALNKEGFPELFSLKKILQNFIEFRHSTIIRKTTYRVQQYQDKIHILFGYTIVLDNISELINQVTESHDTDALRDILLNRQWESPTLRKYMAEINMDNREFFKLTETQVKSILDLKLTNLTKMAGQEVINQINTLRNAIIEGRNIIDNVDVRKEIIKNDLKDIKKYATPRQTVIEEFGSEFEDEDFIPKEDVVITLSSEGFLKRVPLHMYKEQKRGGRGAIGFQNSKSESDYVLQVLVANSHDRLLIFTDYGKVYAIKSYQIPEGGKNTKGRFVLNCLDINEGERVIKILPFREGDSESIIFATNKGTIRRNALSDFSDLRRNGKIYMKPEEGTHIIGVAYASDSDEIMLFTKKGKAIRFNVDELRVFQSRNSVGVRGCILTGGDEVVSLLCLTEENRKNRLVLTITSNGLGKGTSPEAYRKTKKGTKGVNNIRLQKGHYVVSVVDVSNGTKEEEEDNIIVVTNDGQVINCSTNLRAAGRVTQGVIIVKLKEEDYIVSVAKV